MRLRNLTLVNREVARSSGVSDMLLIGSTLFIVLTFFQSRLLKDKDEKLNDK